MSNEFNVRRTVRYTEHDCPPCPPPPSCSCSKSGDGGEPQEGAMVVIMIIGIAATLLLFWPLGWYALWFLPLCLVGAGFLVFKLCETFGNDGAGAVGCGVIVIGCAIAGLCFLFWRH